MCSYRSIHFNLYRVTGKPVVVGTRKQAPDQAAGPDQSAGYSRAGDRQPHP